MLRHRSRPEVRIAVLLALEVRVERGTPFVVLRLIGHRNDRSLLECWTPTIVPPPRTLRASGARGSSSSRTRDALTGRNGRRNARGPSVVPDPWSSSVGARAPSVTATPGPREHCGVLPETRRRPVPRARFGLVGTSNGASGSPSCSSFPADARGHDRRGRGAIIDKRGDDCRALLVGVVAAERPAHAGSLGATPDKRAMRARSRRWQTCLTWRRLCETQEADGS